MTPIRPFFAAVVLLTASAVAAADVAVTVRVRPAGQAYVALVPMWRPASRPIAETIAERGVATLRVPPGAHQLIAGARGFETGSQTVSITAGARNEIAIELRPLTRVAGRVFGPDGTPIAAARVATVNGAIPPPLGFFSELATRYLGAQWSTTTGQDGAWTLMLPAATVPLLFEASGHAAEWRHYRPADPAALDVVLQRGAALTVTLDRTDAAMIVTLLRDGDSGIPADWQPKIWARRATSRTLTWDSLPAGTYTIYAKYPEPRWFMQRAERLASVAVPAQEAVRVALPAARQPAGEVAVAFIETLTRHELGEIEGEHFVEETLGGTAIHLRADGDVPSFVTTADRFIAIEETGTPRRTSLHPRAGVQLHLRPAGDDLQLPPSGSATLRDCAKGKRVMVPVEIRRDGFARFTAPAQCRSTVLAIEPFEPLLFEAPLRAGDQSLGDFIVRAAGSADVRVVREADGAVIDGATVRALAVSDEHPDRATLVVAEAVTGEDGWARLRGLPGDRGLRIIAESDGRTATSDEIRVEPRGRAVVDPLPIAEPATLVVEARLSDAFRARFPKARAGTLFVRPADVHRREGERRQANFGDDAAPLRFERLAPGTWQLEAIVAVAGVFSVVRLDDVELRAGAVRNLAVTLEPNVFSGTITAAGTPVAARIHVEDAGRALSFNSDANGAFHIALQKPGVHRVDAALLARQTDTIPLGDIAFTDPSRPIELRIPETGSVVVAVRNGGRPAANVVVRAWRRDANGSRDERTSRNATTDARGERRFEDLLGTWTFAAADGERHRGAEKSITVQAGERATVALDLRPANVIDGTVRDAAGVPLPRARIDCLFLGASGQPSTAGASSDGQGNFAVELLAPPAAPVLCSVIAPSGAVDAFRAEAGRPVDVRLPAGTAPAHLPEWSGRDELWLAAPDGRVIRLAAVASRLGRLGQPLTIPALAAGPWRLVRSESVAHWLALAAGSAASLPVVRENVR